MDSELNLSGASMGAVRGHPSDEELAAVVAVLNAVADTMEHQDAPRDLPTEQSRWSKSQRPLRGLPRDPFATGAFGSRYR